MLKSMKQKFSGKKTTASTSKDEPSGSLAGKPGLGISTSKAANLSRPTSAIREKPAIPALTEAMMQEYYAEPLPSFRDCAPSEKANLFVSKLHLCSFTFDFSDPTKHAREKEVKRQTLLELVDYANTGSGKFTEAVSEDIIFFLSSNLFRTLPPLRNHAGDSFEGEEEEPSLDPAWSHLQVHRRLRARAAPPARRLPTPETT